MADLEQLNDLLENNDAAKPLMDVIQQIMELPDSSLNENTIESFTGAVNGAFTPNIREQAIKQMVESMEENGLSKADVHQQNQDMINSFNELLDELTPSEYKKILLKNVFQILFDLSLEAEERYHNYTIELPIQLEEGAHVPTYAYETDAAADLYALHRTDLNAHTYGNLVHTGVRIQLPEGWLALVLPRSGMSKNTPFRVSNAPGLIDSSYRGEICVLLDNNGDTDSFVDEGARIAQLLVMPNYRFKAKIVDSLESSDRGEGGFGSTGV